VDGDAEWQIYPLRQEEFNYLTTELVLRKTCDGNNAITLTAQGKSMK
jgi:hypothetical protein